MKTPISKSPARGFTLIELMVAMGITAIIVTVLVTITSVATDTWTRSRAEVRASRQAKVALDIMAKDFESMVSRSGSSAEWLFAGVDSSSDLPPVSRESASGGDALKLVFMTAATDRYAGRVGESYPENNGDVSCVAYQLFYQDPLTGSSTDERLSTFTLHRMLIDPDETFEKLLGQENLEGAFGPFRAELREPQNFVCENIHQLTATFLVEVPRPSNGGSGPTSELVRATIDGGKGGAEFLLKGTGIETVSLDVPGVTPDELKAGRLVGVELSISVITDAGLARIQATGSGLNEKDYGRNAYHYSRTVDVPSM